MPPDRAVVLMPSFGTCPVRAEHQAYVTDLYRTKYTLPVVLGSDQAQRGFYSRARAVNAAARQAWRDHPDRDLFVIADNDLVPDERHLRLALELAPNVPAVTPHGVTLSLTEAATVTFKLNGTVGDHKAYTLGPWSYVVVHRDVFERVNGMDERFEGWGAEDTVFIISIQKQVGRVEMLQGKRVHLWHPVDPSRNDRRQRARNRMRRQMYERSNAAYVRLLARQYGPLNLRGKDGL